MEEQNGLERLASHRIQGVLPKKYHMEYRSGSESLVEEQSLKEVEEMILAAGENIDVPESLQPGQYEPEAGADICPQKAAAKDVLQSVEYAL